MIEGLQVVVHMQLFHLKTPGNMIAFFAFFSELTNFEIFDSEKFTNAMGYYPEMDSFSLNFQNAGYDNYSVVPNLGS